MTPKTVRDLSSRQLVHVRLSGVPVLELTGALPLHVYLLAKLADPEGIEPPSARVGIQHISRRVNKFGTRDRIRTYTLLAQRPQRCVATITPPGYCLVVPSGVEPLTSSMSTKRSTDELRNYEHTTCPIILRVLGRGLVPQVGLEPTRTRHWLLRPAWLPLHHRGNKYSYGI